MLKRAVPLVALVAVVGCTPEVTVRTVPLVDQGPSQAKLVVTPGAAANVDPAAEVAVLAEGGLVRGVRFIGPDGEIPGTLADDATTWWAPRDVLEYASTYTLEATAVDYLGREITEVVDFRTVEPEKYFSATATPAEGEIVGVGIPITVRFTKKVQDKAAVEGALVVRTPEPLLGAWAWVSDRTVEFRPKDLWPGDMPVTLEMNLEGVQAAPGVFGRADVSQTFTYRPSMVSVVDAATHTMDVYQAGNLVRTIPVTTGKPGWETRSGTKVLISKERSRVMDAATGGISAADPEYYRVTAEYAMRLTNSGEFVHAAPWSEASQGLANVSHGCVGMSTENAEWWWSLNNIGDVVIVQNTPRIQGNDGNGLTVWNDTWEQWLARSETGPRFTQTPTDSNA